MHDAIEIFRRFGYDSNEAAFLTLAAIHSGYFVRRQYADFLGQGRGGNEHRFIEKILQKGHATFTRYHLNRIVYHIRAKTIYNRLGQTDNRNRRDKAPRTLKRKLMCLDFVLAHKSERLLETESEKVAYFTADREIPLADLPVRRYAARTSGACTDRYFVDKLPIFVAGSDPVSPLPVVHFAYVDEGAETLQGFETFLSQYHPLLTALQRFEVVFVAGNSAWFEKAAKSFSRFGGQSSPLAPEDFELLDFFQVRRKFEAKDYAGLDTDRIVQYREQKRRYADAAHEAQYRCWLLEGDRALNIKGTSSTAGGSFRTMLIPHDYDIFEGIRHAS